MWVRKRTYELSCKWKKANCNNYPTGRAVKTCLKLEARGKAKRKTKQRVISKNAEEIVYETSIKQVVHFQ